MESRADMGKVMLSSSLHSDVHPQVRLRKSSGKWFSNTNRSDDRHLLPVL